MNKSAGPTSSAYWTASARAERAERYASRFKKASGCSCLALEQCKEKLKKLINTQKNTDGKTHH